MGISTKRGTLMSGDATITTGGAIDLAAKAVDAAEIALANTKFMIGGAGGAAAEYTLSGDVTNTNAGAVTIANDAVTSAKLAETTVQYAEQSFSAAQIKTLYSANTNKGLSVVAAQGATKFIEFISAVMWYDYDGSNAYTAANGLTFNIDSTAVSATSAATFLQATADQIGILQVLSAENDVAAANLLNKALYLQEGTADPTGSATATDQLKVKVAYRVHTLA